MQFCVIIVVMDLYGTLSDVKIGTFLSCFDSITWSDFVYSKVPDDPYLAVQKLG